MKPFRNRDPQCSLIIIAFYGDRWLYDCIEGFKNLSKDTINIVLVDNWGNSAFEGLDLAFFNHEIIKCSEPLGFAEANNFALTHAAELGEFVAFVNQDTLTSEDWLAPCMALLKADASIAAVTPLTRTYDDTGCDPYFLECARESSEFSARVDIGKSLKPFYAVPVIPAAAMVARYSVLREVGPFDPVFGSYYEDYDLCRRFRHAGYKVGVCTTGTICHYSGSATNSDVAERRRARWVTRNQVIVRQREIQGNRALSLLKHCLTVFPRGLARSLLGRQGAKPMGPYLLAHWDLLKLTPRLVSRNYDQVKWRDYLATIGWPRRDGRGLAEGKTAT